MFVVFVSNYYRTMKSNTSMDIKLFIYTPAIIEFVLIAICISFSLVVLSYEIYQVLRKIIFNKRVSESKTESIKIRRRNSTEESFEALN
jgi:hypothetical protein